MKRLLKSSLLSSTFLLAGTLLAQVPSGWDAAEFQVSRQELQELLDRYEAVLNSPGYGAALREDAQRSADLIRTRLQEGDFRAGDRILIRLGGAPELFPDTLLVERGSVITLPDMGEISLHGVLRSELSEYLTTEIGRYIRNPRLQIQSLVRISVQGAVGAPGFYVFPAEMLLTDVLMAAGGPGQNSELDQIKIRRGGGILLRDGDVLTALDEGRSLDQLGLRAGDEITVPETTQSNWVPTMIRWGVIILSTAVLGVRIF